LNLLQLSTHQHGIRLLKTSRRRLSYRRRRYRYEQSNPWPETSLTRKCIGIGAAVAKAFVRSGCSRLAITDINATTLDQTRDAIHAINPEARVLTQVGDISEEAFVSSLSSAVAAGFSRLDYAVHCAGILGESLRSTETKTEAFDRITRVNYRATWLCSRAALEQMLKQEPLKEHPEQRGAIVNIASQLGIVARPGAGT
jgi:NAD(P)-dependent dehydrogenase (short-subunit alcohol dehydrogenase family)